MAKNSRRYGCVLHVFRSRFLQNVKCFGRAFCEWAKCTNIHVHTHTHSSVHEVYILGKKKKKRVFSQLNK